ncbi:hypothetical protein [Mobilicoccus massiliensis]|uniref:hypothetical protein n=1 Tax=Mobilicoccus massiliensis TaxID=1522310 RepID=UPI0011449C73|nr:hypothetical protein [Mobilicoccus massiliensis]
MSALPAVLAVCVVAVVVIVIVTAVLFASRPQPALPDSPAWVDTREPVVVPVLPNDLWEEIEEVSAASRRPLDDVVREAVRRHREDLVAAGQIDECGESHRDDRPQDGRDETR